MASPRPMMLALGGASAALLFTAGCGGTDSSTQSASAGPSASPTSAAPTTTATDSPQSGASLAGSASVKPTATTTVTATPHKTTATKATSEKSGVNRCHTSQLSARVSPGGAAAGQLYQYIVLTNKTKQTCTVYGYGGMKLIGTGKSVPTTLVREKGAKAKVTLAPGKSASSRIHWTDVPTGNEPGSGSCEPVATKAWITPPDETNHIVIGWKDGAVCGHGRISQLPYVAGAKTSNG